MTRPWGTRPIPSRYRWLKPGPLGPDGWRYLYEAHTALEEFLFPKSSA